VEAAPPATGDRGAPDVHPPAQPGGPTAIHHRDDPNARGRRRRGEQRTDQPRGDQRPREPRPPRERRERPAADGRGSGGDGRRERHGEAPATAPSAETRAYEPVTPRLEARRRSEVPDDDEPQDSAANLPAVAWGTDDDSPAPTIVLAPDLPPEVDDEDPVSYPLLEAPSAQLGGEVASVCGVRFVPGGRLSWFDAGDADYAAGDRVLVDSERGARLGWIAAPPVRRASRDRGMRRVVRRANEQDLKLERDGDDERTRALRLAKDIAAALRLPLKVFRIEVAGQLGRGAKLNVYYTTDERLDLRDFVREIGRELQGSRIELRQLGVRDEAKAVGGIGSCGLTLCCTTWLPDFVPVSIKMAKDQGLVLSPTKVSGQCGRLKCCLVYEQAGYAELRKGLPKLGKRVIGTRGEGRVVEVDVLRQRVRVSYGPGDTEVVPATEVKPVFPSGNPPPGEPRAERPPRDRRGRDDRPPDRRDAPAADVDPAREMPEYEDLDDGDELGPTDDPSSLHHDPALDELGPALDAIVPPEDEVPEHDPLADVPDLPDD
jgi:cell fate regulator YaaT (PSP1 superfamily)